MFKRLFFSMLLFGVAWAKPVTTRFFEVTAPDTWEDRQTSGALYFLFPGKDVDDPEDANISISTSSISGGMSMDGLTFMGKHQIEQEYPEMVLGTSAPTKLGKLAAHRFEYKGIRKGKKYEIVQIFAMNGKTSYQIQFIGSEAD
ncbi:MAG: hypothetical protein KIS61_28405, partial [Candidatus Eremiobacteraeota bacterium]|nr:hypothetical protein [Candidatus Eremiobacteraeota bacterium]